MGDHWSAACKAYMLAKRYSSRAELWVISAGYGLIESSKAIKPYSATFANGSGDSVWRGAQDGDRQECLQAWWRTLPHDATLPELLESDNGTVVIAAGAPYLTPLATDLANVVENDLSGDRVSIISAGTRAHGSLLPISGRFRAGVGGTDGALNARLLAILAADGSEHRFRRAAMSATVAQMAARIPATKRNVGEAVTDEQVMREINLIRRRNPSVSRTGALRALRHSGVACEQARFASLWQR